MASIRRVRARVARGYQRLTARNRVLPDFIIIGAQKAGTSSLYAYLNEHPQILAAATKEVHFFDINFHRGLSWYRSFFPLQSEVAAEQQRLGKPVITGEGSPYYLFHPVVPRRIHDRFPRIKLIVLLRNPVTRAYSHYQHSVRKGYERLAFSDALAREPERLRGEEERLSADARYCSLNHQRYSYFARGLYRGQLQRYFALFPREQVLVLSSEQLFADPENTTRQALRFLGLEPGDLKNKQARNTGEYDRKSIPLADRLQEQYAPHNQELYAYLKQDFGW